MQYDDTILRVVFSADGRMAAGGSEGGIVRVWDTATGEALTTPLRINEKLKFRNEIRQLEFTADDSALIAAGYAGGCFWKLHSTAESLPRLQALAQLLSGQRYDARAGMIPLDASSLRAAWTRWQASNQQQTY